MRFWTRATLFASALLPVLGSCAGPRGDAPAAPPEVSTWGTMREVLRLGRSHGRVALGTLADKDAIGVGALEDLAGEVTILDGRVLVAEGAVAERAAPVVRAARDGDSAALLVHSRVAAWDSIPLGDCASYAELEDRIAEALRARGATLSKPTPIRIRGRARHLALHVIAGACPIAQPDGPAPWRFSGPAEAVELVGFYIEGAAARLTHHNRRSHLHALAGARMGHLDEIALDGAQLSLPKR